MLVQAPNFIRSLFPSLIWKNKTKEKEVWLTFDDGPTPEVTPWILTVLKQQNIKATFFLIGEKIEKHPALTKDIINQGHLIANHSYSHINGWCYTKKNYIKNVEKCQELMPRNKLFRPPYGKITRTQISALKRKYKIILWDVLAWDFQQKKSPEKVKKNILMNTTKGSIIVLHNNNKSFKNIKPILEETIQQLKQKGFSFSITW